MLKKEISHLERKSSNYVLIKVLLEMDRQSLNITVHINSLIGRNGMSGIKYIVLWPSHSEFFIVFGSTRTPDKVWASKINIYVILNCKIIM